MNSKLLLILFLVLSGTLTLACPDGLKSARGYCVSERVVALEFDGISTHVGNWSTQVTLFNDGKPIGNLECPSRTPTDPFPNIDIPNNAVFFNQANVRVHFFDGARQCKQFENMLVRTSQRSGGRVLINVQVEDVFRTDGEFLLTNSHVQGATEYDENENSLNSFQTNFGNQWYGGKR